VIPGLSGKKIFITGGTGFLGSLVLRRLKSISESARSGVSVTVLTRNPEKFRAEKPELLWSGLEFIKGNVTNFRFDSRAGFDFVIHGGNSAEAPANEIENKLFRETTIEGTDHLLAEIERLAEPPRKILLLSSGAVYRATKTDHPYSESDPTIETDSKESFSPARAYAEAKFETESRLKKFAARLKIPLALGRIFACAGPYIPLEGRFALGQFIRSARENGEIQIHSDGTPLRTYLAGDELAEWLLTLLAGEGSGTEIYNIGSDDAISILGVAEAVREVFAKRGKSVSVSLSNPGLDSRSARGADYVPNIDKFAENYGLKPRKSSIQAIQETTEWVLNETRSLS